MKTHKDGTQPNSDQVFVFGSNTAGIHGAGAARAALSYGARYGEGVGIWGRTYAIPTKDSNIETLDINIIQYYVSNFNACVKANPDVEFFLTRVGCGLAGIPDTVMAPLFEEAPNLDIPEEWVGLLSKS